MTVIQTQVTKAIVDKAAKSEDELFEIPAGIELQAAEVSMVPQAYIKLEGGGAKTMLKLYDVIEDYDDVQKVYANFDIDESEME